MTNIWSYNIQKEKKKQSQRGKKWERPLYFLCFDAKRAQSSEYKYISFLLFIVVVVVVNFVWKGKTCSKKHVNRQCTVEMREKWKKSMKLTNTHYIRNNCFRNSHFPFPILHFPYRIYYWCICDLYRFGSLEPNCFNNVVVFPIDRTVST